MELRIFYVSGLSHKISRKNEKGGVIMDFRENSIKLSMTTKGLWIVEQLSISNDNILEAIEDADVCMIKLNRILGIRNRYRTPEIKEKK